MNIYEMTMEMNNRLIEGGTLSSAEKQFITETFLSGISDRRTVIRFHNGVKAPKPEDGDPMRNIPNYIFRHIMTGKST